MSLIKIHNGTVREDVPHLCDSCCRSHHRIENGKQRYFCESRGPFNEEVRGRISECSTYLSNADRHATAEFRGLAWELDYDEDEKGSRKPIWTTPAGRRHRRRRARLMAEGSNPNPTPDPRVQ